MVAEHQVAHSMVMVERVKFSSQHAWCVNFMAQHGEWWLKFREQIKNQFFKSEQTRNVVDGCALT
jgi:hypothetical protein